MLGARLMRHHRRNYYLKRLAATQLPPQEGSSSSGVPFFTYGYRLVPRGQEENQRRSFHHTAQGLQTPASSASPDSEMFPQKLKAEGVASGSRRNAVERGYHLQRLTQAQSIAVIGFGEATGFKAEHLLRNLVNSDTKKKNRIYPIHSAAESVEGLKTYPDLQSIPEALDLALVVSPPDEVPKVVKDCIDKKVKNVVVMSRGFEEQSQHGHDLQTNIMKLLENSSTRLLGPNSSGIMIPRAGINATLVPMISLPGHVGFAFEGSGGYAMLDWSQSRNVGISSFISVGNKGDIDWGEVLGLFRDDPYTKALCLFIESVGHHARQFVSAARELALKKPIIAIHAGKTREGSQVAFRDSGVAASEDQVIEAAFLRCGILRVGTINTLYKASMALSLQPAPRGPRLAIISNSSSSSVLAVDGLIYNGGMLEAFTAETLEAMKGHLPEDAIVENPVLLPSTAPPEMYLKAVECAMKDKGCDAVLVIHAPLLGISATAVAAAVSSVSKSFNKPLLACMMGGNPDVEQARRVCIEYSTPCFDHPDEAARVFNIVQQYSFVIESLYDTPFYPKRTGDATSDRKKISSVLEQARAENRYRLTQEETSLVLGQCGIELLPYRGAKTEDEAVDIAKSIGFPVVMKRAVRHGKRDAILGLADENLVRQAFNVLKGSDRLAAAEAAGGGIPASPASDAGSSSSAAEFSVKMQRMLHAGYELRLSSRVHKSFGPILEFGVGSKLGGQFQDDVVGLPPLTSTLARRMMEQTRIYQALYATTRHALPKQTVITTGGNAGIRTLEGMLVLFSEIIAEFKLIKEININPLLIIPDDNDELSRLVALDASIVLFDQTVPEKDIPEPAILPYPQHLVKTVVTRGNRTLTIRPIRPEDEEGLRTFHQDLSEESVRLRYFQFLRLAQRISHERLSRSCFIDYTQEMALVAVDEKGTVLGVGKLFKHAPNAQGTAAAEFAVLVHDSVQGQGLGSIILKDLIDFGRVEWKLNRIVADVLPTNAAMKNLCKRFGFASHLDIDEGVLKVELDLPEEDE